MGVSGPAGTADAAPDDARDEHTVTRLQAVHLRAGLGHRADGLVAKSDARTGRCVVIKVQIGPADGSCLHRDDDPLGTGKHRIGHVAQGHHVRPFQNGCSHPTHANSQDYTERGEFSVPVSQAVLSDRLSRPFVPTSHMTRTQPSTTIEVPVLDDVDVDAFYETEDLWAVIVWNDDVTTFQTVIQAFVEILGHTVERADQLAWKIHRTGKAVAAIRPKVEAEAAVHALHLRKIQATMARA